LGADSKNCGTARISLERVTVARTGPVVRGKNSIDRKDQLARGGVKGWGELESSRKSGVWLQLNDVVRS
jgi:hypothetical protein